MNTSTLRGDILAEASRLTCGDREDAYGPPAFQLTSSQRIKLLMREIEASARIITPTKRFLSLGEWEALDNHAIKLSRILCGPVVKLDNYVDLAAYDAIAGECALGPDRLEDEADAPN